MGGSAPESCTMQPEPMQGTTMLQKKTHVYDNMTYQPTDAEKGEMYLAGWMHGADCCIKVGASIHITGGSFKSCRKPTNTSYYGLFPRCEISIGNGWRNHWLQAGWKNARGRCKQVV